MDRNLGGILVTRKLNRAENTAQDGRKDMEFPGKRNGMDKRKIAFEKKKYEDIEADTTKKIDSFDALRRPLTIGLLPYRSHLTLSLRL